MKYIFIIITIFLSFCSKKQTAFVTNFSGASFSFSADSSNPSFLPFGTKLTVYPDKTSAGRVLASSDKEKDIYLQAGDVSDSLPQKVFAGSLAGIKLPGGSILEFGQSAELMEVKNEFNRPVLRIKIGQKEYSVSPEGFEKNEPKKYFFVSSRTGLNLRKGPGTSYPIIETLKYGTTAQILKTVPKLELIQKALGVWFYTELNGMKGWMFSGFVLTASSEFPPPSAVSSEISDSDMQALFTAIDSENFGSSTAGKTVWKKKFGKIQISLMKRNEVGEQEKSCGMGEEFIHISGPNIEQYLSSYNLQVFSEELIESGFLFYSGRPCGCCCAPTTFRVIALAENGLKSAWYENSNASGCSTMEASFLKKDVSDSFRIEKNTGTLFLKREYPVCEEVKKEEGQSSQKEFSKTDTKYSFNVFRIINGELKQENYEISSEDGIPEEWKLRYNDAEPFSPGP